LLSASELKKCASGYFVNSPSDDDDVPILQVAKIKDDDEKDKGNAY
jgi:hypothetical protein